MAALVVYESMTGTTKLAGELIAVELLAAGMPTRVTRVDAVTADEVADADLVIVGTWTDGLLVVGQRPGRKGKLRRLPSLGGKRVGVYCTFAIDSGKTLEKLAKLCTGLGGDVVDGMAIHRKRVREGAVDHAARLLESVKA